MHLIVSAFKQRAAHFLSPPGEKVIYQPDPTWREADAHCSLRVVSQYSESRQMLPGQTRSFALETNSCPFLLRRALTSPHQSRAKLPCDSGTVAEVIQKHTELRFASISLLLSGVGRRWRERESRSFSQDDGGTFINSKDLLVLLYWDLLKVELLGFTEKKKKVIAHEWQYFPVGQLFVYQGKPFFPLCNSTWSSSFPRSYFRPDVKRLKALCAFSISFHCQFQSSPASAPWNPWVWPILL